MKVSYYNRAMDKIKASDELKEKIISSVKSGAKRKTAFDIYKIAAVAAMFILVIASVYFSGILDKSARNNSAGHSGEFKIIGHSGPNVDACYMSVLYLDGYRYEAESWFSYSINEYLKMGDELKGEKIGEITLDLKGLIYEGTPPDFSSTYDAGTQIYEVKGLKREYAVLLDTGDSNLILYRSRKAVASEDEPIGLTVKEVINMISDSKVLESVELRSEEDGSWMRTSYDNRLLELLKAEIMDKELLNSNEIKQKEESLRVPVNLIFKDGVMLHMQVYPEDKYVHVFGGYINISEELSKRFKELYSLGNEFPRITDLIDYNTGDIGYFKFTNHVTGDEIVSPEPQWAWEVLYGMLKFYSLDRSSSDVQGNLVFTVALGKSEENSSEIKIYEGTDKNLVFRINGETYRIVKGSLLYSDFMMYQEDYISY